MLHETCLSLLAMPSSCSTCYPPYLIHHVSCCLPYPWLLSDECHCPSPSTNANAGARVHTAIWSQRPALSWRSRPGRNSWESPASCPGLVHVHTFGPSFVTALLRVPKGINKSHVSCHFRSSSFPQPPSFGSFLLYVGMSGSDPSRRGFCHVLCFLLSFEVWSSLPLAPLVCLLM